jgi:glycosyltransferase involved in cell wall biosynthesis
MQKKTILHFIQELGRGGAELMLLKAVKELPEYNNIVVTMYGDNPFGNELYCDKYISMNLKSSYSLAFAIKKLRRIINENNVALIHTHLLWPTVIARIATPKKIPLITTIHTSVATSYDYKLWRIRVIDKISYRIRKSIIIGVSKGALNEYFSFLKLKPFKSYVLYTFVDTCFFNFQQISKTEETGKLKVVSMGTLKEGKNFEFLINAFRKHKNPNIELHIFGKGLLEKHLKKMIEKTDGNIVLKGEVDTLDVLLPNYDLYVSASDFEGFSLAVLEAMAAGLPMLLSNIASFKEQCEDTAFYFDQKDENDFIKNLYNLIYNKEERDRVAKKAQQRALESFTLHHHISGLKKIYNETFESEFS